LVHCPNRSPNAVPLKEQSAQKEHTVAWDLNGAQSVHPMILTVDVSTEAEAPPVQFNPINMPQVKKVPPSYPPSTRHGLVQNLEEISEEKPSRQRRKPLKEEGLPRGNWFASARARSIGFGLIHVLPKESACQALSD
jgi:hypothetical protein